MKRKKLKFTKVKNLIQSEEAELEYREIVFDIHKNHIFILGVPTKKKNTEMTISLPMKYGERVYLETYVKENGKSKQNKNKDISTK